MNENEKPKYQKLKEFIIEKISSDNLKPGDKLMSENELANKFSISRHTVRQALGEMVSEGWLYKVQGKGTFVDRQPGSKESVSKTIAVLTTYLNDYIFPSIIRGIDGVLSSSGYNIMLSCTYNQHFRERQCLENLLHQNIDGLIVEPTKSALPNPNIELYKELSAKGIPVLFIHGCYKELQYSYVVEDDEMAGFIATEHLAKLGHKEIGGIFKIDDIQGHLRYSGFQKVHNKRGIPLSDDRIVWFETEDAGGKLSQSSSKAVTKLLKNCSAIVCYNDQIAQSVLDIAREMDLSVPEKISLISFDDSQMAIASEVKLTTIAHPKDKLGKKAAEYIMSMLENKIKYVDVKMKPELIVRGSTAPFKSTD